MTVHLVGSGIASLAAAVFLIRDAGIAPGDIEIYEQSDNLDGAMEFSGNAAQGYCLPATRVLEREYRCGLDLMARFPSVSDAQETIEEDTLEFNASFPYRDKARLIDKDGRVFSAPRFGVSLADRFNVLKLLWTSESALDGKAIDSYFTPEFYQSEFFLAWSTLMGPLRQHSAVEFRRYFLRFLHVVPVIDTMADVWRMRLNQREWLAAPIRKRLTEKGVHFNPGTVVKDMTFRAAGRDVFTDSIRLSTGETAVPMTEKDAVLVTLGSQVANMRKGTTTTAPTSPPSPADAWRLWTQIKENARTQLGREDFGDPTAFFKAGDPSSTWVTFTITLRDRLFFERLTALSGSGPRRQGLVTLIDSPWLITLAPLPHPHFLGQPDNVEACWGFSLCHDRYGNPDRPGDFVKKPVTACSGQEILEEIIGQLGFQSDAARIMSSDCIPVLLPHANSVWLRRSRKDRPNVVPDGAKNFAFIGQFCEMPEDTMFTMEYSIRSAAEAVGELFHAPTLRPPVYQGLWDCRAVWGVLKTFVF